MEKKASISLKKVEVHNLKEVDLELPIGEFIVFTGVSGSGKSSMAFDTLFAEGQRRYIESLSAHLWHYIEQLPKPELKSASGLSPTFAIEQKQIHPHPRSTVGTMTEIYDYLRILFAKTATAYCPVSLEPLKPFSKEQMLEVIKNSLEPQITIFVPICRQKKGTLKEEVTQLKKKGFYEFRVDGTSVTFETLPDLDPKKPHDLDVLIDRFDQKKDPSRLSEAINIGLELAQSLIVQEKTSLQEHFYSTEAYSPKSGLSYPPLTPSLFSFNHPSGMCEQCQGLGIVKTFNLDLIIDPDKSLQEDCCSIASSFHTVKYGNIYRNLADIYDFKINTPWKDLSKEVQTMLLYGTKKKWTRMLFKHPTKKNQWEEYIQWRGFINDGLEKFHEAKSAAYKKRMSALMHSSKCQACGQSRLKPYPSAAQFCGQTIFQIVSKPFEELLSWFKNIHLDSNTQLIAQDLLFQITKRLQFLCSVGIGYLCLDRSSPSLSGGEAQRVRLASYLGSAISGVTYILDEPSIGLHPRDHHKLIGTLLDLKKGGNTVIVVEHDEQTILAADRVVDFGPKAGVEGGEILVNGSLEELKNNPNSITGAYLSGQLKLEVLKGNREQEDFVCLKNASLHNLKHVDVRFPLGNFVAITGVSGSGKSSLIVQTLVPALENKVLGTKKTTGPYDSLEGFEKIDKIISIDQTPIGRTSRSNPATYLKVFDEIRKLFSQLPESLARGYDPGQFSFNVASGSCPQCLGKGVIKIDMDFMEDNFIPCPSCENRRFDEETLSILYKGKNIFEVLQMTVKEAYEFFDAFYPIKRRLKTLIDVGMEYITLGQSATTLSGGEAQRIKLAKELSKIPKQHTLYILDEPTTGLHFYDIQKLLNILHQLVDAGHTVMVIEHHMDLVKTADWIIDLGPDGGAKGGEVIGMGSVEKVSTLKTPTGIALAEALEGSFHTFTKHPTESTFSSNIEVIGANQNNLKNVTLAMPKHAITLFTGPSGSGKSSLAFDTIYNEGQRRYFESLSTWAKQFVHKLPQADVSRIEGLSPTVAIEQKHFIGHGRSTVATSTEIYDYLRLLFVHAGVAYCPETGEKIEQISKQDVIDQTHQMGLDQSISILAPLKLSVNQDFTHLCSNLKQRGFLKLKMNDTLYDLDEPIPFSEKNRFSLAVLIDRFRLKPSSQTRLYDALSQALALSKDEVIVQVNDEEHLFRMDFTVAKTGKSYPRIKPTTFSFNHIDGMCLECQGMGVLPGASFFYDQKVQEYSFFALADRLFEPFSFELINALAEQFQFDAYTPLEQLDPKVKRLLIEGNEFLEIPLKGGMKLKFKGLKKGYELAARIGKKELKEELKLFMEDKPCPACEGMRLNRLAQSVRIKEHSIVTLVKMPIEKILSFIKTITLSKEKQRVLQEVVMQIESRLAFLQQVGLGYLTLDRSVKTLSHGEAQRIRLAKQLGSELRGITYVLDEPTIGLHPADVDRLKHCLLQLKELGNTLIMVEHDTEMMNLADLLVDFGPKGGASGGFITAQGSLDQIKQNPDSLTGSYLSGKKTIPFPSTRRSIDTTFTVPEATAFNLKGFTASIPTQAWTCITGVSGSGKSTLLNQEILPLITQHKLFSTVHVLDQKGIGQTSRSDVSTYSDLAPLLREFYSSLAESKMKGLGPRHFSCNTPAGMCHTCQGFGYQKVQLLLLPDVRVPCKMCGGYRFGRKTLEIKYQNMHFGQLLDRSVEEIKEIFPSLAKVQTICDTLISVGLGYLKLNQEMQTLSGGEAQRLKLSKELSKRGKGKTLYLLDEPTTGLHPNDIEHLIVVLQKLVDQKATIIMIEHHLDMIKQADYILELGPKAGMEGGHLIFSGTFEQMLQSSTSITGPFFSKISLKKT